MTHDALCPSLNCIDSTCDECCCCELITKIREDEQEKQYEAQSKNWISGHKVGQRDMLDKCIETVKSLGSLDRFEVWTAEDGCTLSGHIEVDVVAALRELEEKP